LSDGRAYARSASRSAVAPSRFGCGSDGLPLLDQLTPLLADFLWRSDHRGRIDSVEFLNSYFPERIAKELRGLKLLGLLGSQDASDELDAARTAIEHGRSFRDLLLSFSDSSGQTCFLALCGQPRTNRSGSVVGYDGLGRAWTSRPFDTQQKSEMAYLLQVAEETRAREERLRREAEVLLRSLTELIKPATLTEKCLRLFEPFREFLRFDQAMILRHGVKGRLNVAAATDVSLVGQVVQDDSFFRSAVTSEGAVINDMIGGISTAGEIPDALKAYRSALLSIIRIGKESALLLAVHTEPNHFSDFDLRFMRRLSLIATEALQSDEQRTLAINASKLASLGEVIAGIAHEINQPLSVISMAAANIRHRLAGSEQSKWVETKADRIEQQIGHVGEIVKSIRSFAYPQKSPQATEALDLHELMRSVELLAIGGIRKRGISLELDIPEVCPRVQANSLGLQQVLVNLINNARDAIGDRQEAVGREFRGKIVISVVIPPGGARASLFVRDNGGGVPEHALNQVFDSFYTLKEQGKGTGLGLPICKTLIESVGGTIAIRNAGDGAEVEVCLKVADSIASDASAGA
jgi:signal transduction histidine kinase